MRLSFRYEIFPEGRDAKGAPFPFRGAFSAAFRLYSLSTAEPK